jgi:hypothetical protein
VQALAAADQPLCHGALWERVTPRPTKQQFYHALQTLQRAFLIHQEKGRLKTATLLAAYLTEAAQAHETEQTLLHW